MVQAHEARAVRGGAGGLWEQEVLLLTATGSLGRVQTDEPAAVGPQPSRPLCSTAFTLRAFQEADLGDENPWGPFSGALVLFHFLNTMLQIITHLCKFFNFKGIKIEDLAKFIFINH